MEEIEVGEYVRTKNQGIKRVDTIFPNKTVNKYGYEIGSEWDGKLYSTVKTTDIVKHSLNIIDLIEIGDYVNGHKVIFDECFDKLAIIRVYGGNIRHTAIEYFVTKNANEKITSIVTKEQFASMEYKVGE